jgi:hypothetical protein
MLALMWIIGKNISNNLNDGGVTHAEDVLTTQQAAAGTNCAMLRQAKLTIGPGR